VTLSFKLNIKTLRTQSPNLEVSFSTDLGGYIYLVFLCVLSALVFTLIYVPLVFIL
jgi:hypothetical protein